MLDGPGEKASSKTQVSLRNFLQSEVKIIHIIVQNNTYSTTGNIIVLYIFILKS